MASRAAVKRNMLAFVFSFLTLAMAGCGTDEERSALRHAAAAADETMVKSDLFHVDVQLFYRTAGRRWRLSDESVFPVRDESFVKAEVTLHNIRPQRTYSCHLVWIRPDGREMFRRYAEVIRHEVGLPGGVIPDTSGTLPPALVDGWRKSFGDEQAEQLVALLAADPGRVVPIDEVQYKKAIDLAFAQRILAVGKEASITVDSRLNISRERGRAVGLYHLRVYLDRRLLRTVPFEIVDEPRGGYGNRSSNMPTS